MQKNKVIFSHFFHTLIFIIPLCALFPLFLFFPILCMKYGELTSTIIKFMVYACYTAHYSLTVVCPAVWKICIAFKWERSIQTIVKILLHLYVFLYELVKKIIFYSTLGQHFTTIKWKVLALLLLWKESWPKRHNSRKHNWKMIKKISLLPYEAISQWNVSCWYLKSEHIPFCNSFICVHNLYKSFEREKNEALAFNPKGVFMWWCFCWVF